MIRQQNNMLQTILDALPHPVYVINVDDYSVEIANTAARQGVADEDVTCYALTRRSDSPCQADDQSCPLTLVKATGKPATVEHVYVDLRGNQRRMGVHGVPIFDASGEVIQMIEYMLDMTERKHFEHELHAAWEAAEAANSAKSSFLANISHEIRTPLNAILGMTHLAGNTDLSAQQRDYLRKIDSSAHILLTIINDVLDFSKIEAGKLDMEAVNVQLDDILKNVSNLLALKAREKNLELVFHTASDVPVALIGDPLRIGQVLANLVNNAIKFTESGEIVVSTRVLPSDSHTPPDHVRLKFTVRDTGIGMNAGQVARLFQPFTQADSSTTRKYGGTGLGLTICKRLITMMGGEIWAESQPSVGSTFHFTLMLRRQLHDSTVTLPNWSDICVLVVDDNQTSLEILHDFLTSFGCHVALAASAEEGLALLERGISGQGYDLVLMDWKLPGLNGLEATLHIKRQTTLIKIPRVIMITAYSREDIVQYRQDVDFDDVLIKPITRSLLYDRMTHVLSVQASRGSRDALKPDPMHVESLRGSRILLVEDNEINQQFAQELLESAGVLVTVANDGMEAVNAVQQQTFDAVLMDVHMPEMDGYTATRTIRNLSPDYATLPIIALTASAMSEDRRKALEAGMNDYVVKPIVPRKFFATLRKWLKAHGGDLALDTGHWKFERPHGSPLLKKEEGNEGMESAHARPVSWLESESEEFRDTVTEESTASGFQFPVSSFQFLNIRAGLERMGGNAARLRELLLKFAQNYAAVPDDIAAALAVDNCEEAQGLTHTLKGVAGNVGADDVYRTAQTLETAIRAQRREVWQEYAQALRQAMKRVCDFIRTLTSEHKQPPRASAFAEDATKTLDISVFTPIFMQLGRYIEQADTHAIQVADELAPLCAQTAVQADIEQLRASLKRYQFDDAFALWTTVAHTLHIAEEGEKHGERLV